MKYLTFLFVLFFSMDAFAEDDESMDSVDVCLGVECPGKGSCVIVSGNPTCSCDLGYIPVGEHGLACGLADNASGFNADGDQEYNYALDSLFKELPYRDVRKIRDLQMDLRNSGGYTGGIQSLVMGYLKDKRRDSIIFMATGVSLVFVSSFLLVSGYNPELIYGECSDYMFYKYGETGECNYENQKAYTMPGYVSALAAGVFVSYGLFKFFLNRKRIKKLGTQWY